MKKVFRGLKGISVAALVSTLLLSLSVSANMSESGVGSVDFSKSMTKSDVRDTIAVTPFETKQPTIVADGCWIYIGGYWIRVCNHDEPLINRI